MTEFSLRGQLGRGSYGSVYRACHVRTDDDVALKIIPLTDEFFDTQRALRELLALRHIRHPNVLELAAAHVAVWKKSACLVLVTRLHDTTLHKYMRRGPALTPEQIAHIGTKLLQATAHIHACGLMHRDIKPDNILLDADCSVTLCDFGFVRSSNACVDDADELSAYVTTRWYRAPEIAKRIPYNELCDVWSLGCVIAEMHTGAPLWPAQNEIELCALVEQTLVSNHTPSIMRAQTARRAWMRAIKGDGDLVDMLSVEPMERPSATTILARRGVAPDEDRPVPCTLADRGSSETVLRERLASLSTPARLAPDDGGVCATPPVELV